MLDLARVREAIRSGRVRWQKHALLRMAQRAISRADVVAAIERGDVIEDYSSDKPFPSALVLGVVASRPLHVVVALDAAAPYAYVITVYEPGLDRFEADWRTRRRP